jgi:hypothetical protein
MFENPNAHGGFSLPANGTCPDYDKTQTGNTSLSQSARAVWGDRYCPLLSIDCAFLLITVKISTEPINDSRNA